MSTIGILHGVARGLKSLRAVLCGIPVVMLLAFAAPAAAQQPAGEMILSRSTVSWTDDHGNTSSVDAEVVIYLQRNPALTFRKTVDRAVAFAGDTLLYTIGWVHGGGTAVDALTITDSLPATLRFVPGSVRSDATVTTVVNSNVLLFDIGSVAEGTSGQLQFSAVVTQEAGEVSNWVRGAYHLAGTPAGASSDTARTRVDTDTRVASLRLHKAVNTATAMAGDTLTYSIAWRNAGDAEATNTVVQDTLPAAVSMVQGSFTSQAGITATVDGRVLQVSIGTLAPGDSADATFRVVVNAESGVVENVALATYVTRAETVTAGSDTVRTQLTGTAALAAGKTVDRTAATAGDTLTYRLWWSNTGTAAARSAVFRDTLPTGLTYAAGSAQVPAGVNLSVAGNVLEFVLPDVMPGDSGSLSFRAVVDGGTGMLLNTAHLVFEFDGETAVVETDTARTLLDEPAMQLELEALVDRPLQVGDSLTYRLRVRNTHELLTIRNLVVVDSLPAELEYLSAEPAPLRHTFASEADQSQDGDAAHGALGGALVWEFAELAPQAEIEILLHTIVRSIGNGQLVNIASADGAGLRQALSAVASVTGEQASDLSIRKSASMLEAGNGDAVAYMIELENTGAARLEGVVLRVTPEAGVAVQRTTVTGGVPTSEPDAMVFALGAMDPGTRRVIQYAATLTGARGTSLNSTASATTASGLATDTVGVAVRLRDAAMLTRIVAGKVWLDDNRDGTQQADERPLSHAVVWSAFGETVRADSLGRFTFPNMITGRHTFRLDPLSVPSGYLQAPMTTVRVDGWSTPVVSFAVQRDSTVRLMTRADSISAGFLFGDDVLPRPRFAFPSEGAILGSDRTLVRVEGAPAADIELLLDGQKVAQSVLRPDGTEDFIGVEVEPGPHVLTAVMNLAGAEERITLNIHSSGLPVRVARADSTTMRAGSEHVLNLRLLDRWDVPVAQTPLVTVSAGGMSLLDGDLDPVSVGTQLRPNESGVLQLRVRADSAAAARVSVGFGHEIWPVDVAVLPEIRTLVLLGDGEIGIGAGAQSYGAAIARGALDERTSVTLSYDSRRNVDGGAFGGAYDPLGEGRYTVTGDASQRSVVASQTTPLSLRVERDESWLHVGDLNTRAFGGETSPGAYSRALPGMSALWKRGALQLSGFGSSVAQQIVQQQVRADGTSGPYYVGGAMRLGTDRVAVETRDRRNASLVIARQQLERFTDYDVDAASGTILLRRPLRSTDAEGNPQFVVILAERIHGESSFVGGVHAQVARAFTGGRDSVTFGGGYIEDTREIGGHRVMSSTLSALTRWGTGRVELARGEMVDSAGYAVSAGVQLGSTESVMSATLDWTHVGDGFANPANPRLVGGTEDIRLSLRRSLGRGFSIAGGYARQWFEAQGAERTRTTMLLSHAAGSTTYELDLALQDESQRRDTVVNALTSLGGRLTRRNGGTSLWVETLQRLRHEGQEDRASTYSLGATASLGYGISAEASQRFIRGDSAWAAMSTIGLRTQLPTGTRAWGEYQMGNSVDGSQSAALVGIGQKLQVSPTLAVDGMYERRQGLSELPETDVARALPFTQVERDRWAASLGVEWKPSTQLRASLRGELNDGELGAGHRVFGAAEAVLSDSWTLLARHDSRQNRQVSSGLSMRTRALQSILAGAFRPFDRSDWTGLLKVELRQDERPQSGGPLAGAVSDDRVIGAAEVIWTPRTGVELGGRVAMRHSQQAGVFGNGSDVTATSQFAGVRARYMLSSRIDVRGSARLLNERRGDVIRWDAAPALGIALFSGLELEAGYRFGDLQDADFAENGGNGVYAMLGFRVTEQTGRTLAGLWRDRLGSGR